MKKPAIRLVRATLAISVAIPMSAVMAQLASVQDVNLDGISDIVVTNAAGNEIAVFLGKADGTYEKSSRGVDLTDKHATVAQMMKEDKSQVALLLNKDLSITVASVEAGMRARPCAKEPGRKNSADGKNNPVSSDKSCLHAAANPKGEIFYQKTFTVSIVRGSCCVRISSGDQTYELCSGPNIPVEFINQITGQTCPSG